MAVDVLDQYPAFRLPTLGRSGGLSDHDAAGAVAPERPWREGLPTLAGHSVTLRELRLTDAPAILRLLTESEVSQFLAPPPRTGAQFRRFVRWTAQRRAEGLYACFAIVPRSPARSSPVGFFQVRVAEAGATTAEWGFVLGRPYWGTGYFAEGASLVLAFTFERMAVHRLEARAIIQNGRANGALRKIGAVCEGVLRQSYTIDGQSHDTKVWSILERDWRRGRIARPGAGVDAPKRVLVRIQ